MHVDVFTWWKSVVAGGVATLSVQDKVSIWKLPRLVCQLLKNIFEYVANKKHVTFRGLAYPDICVCVFCQPNRLCIAHKACVVNN